jgi:ribosome maturation factor RimP
MRIIMPQHREAIRDHRTSLGRRERVELDVDAIEDISRAISDAMTDDLPVSIRVFDEYDDVYVRGKIARFDQVARRLRIDDADGEVYVDFDDILSVELARSGRQFDD